VNDEGAGWVSGIGKIIFGFGVKIVWGTWAAGIGKGGERSGGLSQVTRGGLEDAVVVDRGDVGPGGGFVLVQEKAGSEEKRSGLRAEDAAAGCHGGLRLSAEGYHDVRKDVSLRSSWRSLWIWR